MNKAVFLDRDGVINNYDKPVNSPQDLTLYSWTASAIKKLNQQDYKVYIVTNQGGIECGYFSQQDLDKIHQHLISTLQDNDAIINDIEFCPHFETDCDCRKPKPGMILKLANKHNVNLDLSYMVGDRKSDIIAGKKAGCTTIKIGAKYPGANYSTDNLQEATKLILQLDNQVPH
ncbi:D-glycero-alpha-D-manno-heptose-1,7-bisphosphate 7-phosphatase [Halanaerobaculum tunisiense]